MPEFDGIAEVGPLVLGAALLALASSLFVALVGFSLTQKQYLETLVFVLPYGLLGVGIGFIAGSSSEALVGALLTGVLTVVGGLLSYAFSKDAVSDGRELLPYSVALLALPRWRASRWASSAEAKRISTSVSTHGG